MGFPIEKIVNANIYIDDVNFIGRASEIDLAKIAISRTEHRTLGMVGPVNLFSGVEAMEARIKWSAFNLDALRKTSPTKSIKLTARAAQQTYRDSSVSKTESVRATMIGRFKGDGPETLKAGEGGEETMFDLDYFKLVVAGVDVIEIDLPNYIYRVDGEDIYTEIRTAIGLN